MKKYVCTVCGYIAEGEIPAQCPVRSRYQQQPAGLISHRRRKNKAEAVLCVQGGFAAFKVHRAKHTVFEDGF